jgi:hypothetical protein
MREPCSGLAAAHASLAAGVVSEPASAALPEPLPLPWAGLALLQLAATSNAANDKNELPKRAIVPVLAHSFVAVFIDGNSPFIAEGGSARRHQCGTAAHSPTTARRAARIPSAEGVFVASACK